MHIDGRVINLLAEGRLVNLAAGDGHPAEIMDMSFAVQALSAKHLLENAGKLGAPIPEWLSKVILSLKTTTDKAVEPHNKE